MNKEQMKKMLEIAKQIGIEAEYKFAPEEANIAPEVLGSITEVRSQV